MEIMPKRILIIEDSEEIRAVFGIALRHAGYEVVEASDGASGLLQRRVSKPDIVILDIGLPGLNGWEVLLLLKGTEHTADIPVLVVTAYASPEHRRRAEQSGAAGFVAKPVEPTRVAEHVSQLIGPP
jgi:CheY-like chemotaxis protein